MSAACGFGITGGLPWDATLEMKKAAILAVAKSGLCGDFFEIINFGEPDESIWQVTCGKRDAAMRQLRAEDVPWWKFWVPQNADIDAARIRKAWATSAGGGLSYDEWVTLGADIFAPGYTGRDISRLEIPGSSHGWTVTDLESGIHMTNYLIEESEDDDYEGLMRAFEIAQEMKFLVVISG